MKNQLDLKACGLQPLAPAELEQTQGGLLALAANIGYGLGMALFGPRREDYVCIGPY